MTLQTALGYVPSQPNLIINGGFTVNQRVYTTGTALAAGVFAHDRWKAGAAGGAYSFTQLDSPTTITITAGTFIQVVDTKNVQGGSYVLSWTGTATARYGLNSATPSGSYVASPILITGQTAGTAISVEFGTGTLTNVKLEMGTVATPFASLPYLNALNECMGMHQVSGYITGVAVDTANIIVDYTFPAPMRAAPTISVYSSSTGTINKVRDQSDGSDVGTSFSASSITNSGVAQITDSGTPFTLGRYYRFIIKASAEL